MKCSICDKEIPVKAGGWSQGNNAEPVNSGRCCDECNMGVVVPARLGGALCGPQDTDESEEDTEHWLYLINHNGYYRVVGEQDNWSVAHEMTGETGRLFAASPDLLSALKLLRDPDGDGQWPCYCNDPHYAGQLCENCIATAAIEKAEGGQNG